MHRRQLLATVTTAAAVTLAPLAGCVGGRGDAVTMLAVNRDDAAHTITAWVVRGDRLRLAETVDVAGGAVERLGDLPPDGGSGDRYRVTVRVDDDRVLARTFAPDEWFNQLDVVVDDGAVELVRGRAA